jgi:hypothetical protein
MVQVGSGGGVEEHSLSVSIAEEGGKTPKQQKKWGKTQKKWKRQKGKERRERENSALHLNTHKKQWKALQEGGKLIYNYKGELFSLKNEREAMKNSYSTCFRC